MVLKSCTWPVRLGAFEILKKLKIGKETSRRVTINSTF